MTVYSPVDGLVVEKSVVVGTSITPGAKLYKIIDLSTVWVYADVYEYELPWVKLGDNVEIELPYLPGKVFNGKVSFIAHHLEGDTRTAKVRINIQHRHFGESIELKPDMFATVKIKSRITITDVVIPEQAVIHSGERHIAVVALGGGYFDPREIKLGLRADGYVQVTDGLKAGEQLVISSQFLIDSESNLRAAVNQMLGHSGHDMSKPMEPQEKTKKFKSEHKEHKMESGGGKMEDGKTEEMKQAEMKEKKLRKAGKKVYTCEMHPEVISDKPGDCPKCGMYLVEKKN
jgi:hypothetical protein